jgi:hypothetical protein
MPKVGSKLIVQADITDWQDDCMRAEEDIETPDDLVRLVSEEGYTPAQVGQWAIVMRELGLSPDDILRPTKALLESGARHEVSLRAAARQREVTMASGKTFQVRELIAPPGRRPSLPGDEDGNGHNGNGHEPKQAGNNGHEPQGASAAEQDRSYAKFDTDRGIEIATRYLARTVPGHIFERFKQLAAAGADVKGAAAALHVKIDEMVDKLVEPAVM